MVPVNSYFLFGKLFRGLLDLWQMLLLNGLSVEGLLWVFCLPSIAKITLIALHVNVRTPRRQWISLNFGSKTKH